MIELSNERIDEILCTETVKKQDRDMILRSVYTRYMFLYETYLADIDELNDDMIASLRSYHEETTSLVKYYYMDIPQDICKCIRELDNQYTSKLLGPEWRKYLDAYYKEYEREDGKHKFTGTLKECFQRETLSDFYDTMDYIFRDGFGTGSAAANDVFKEIKGFLFGRSDKDKG